MPVFGNAKKLAEILEISERRVNQLTSEKGIFEKDLNGKFNISKCVEAYYREKFIETDYGKELEQEKVLLERAKRERAELLLGKLKNELHEATVIELAITNMLVTFRNRILGIPAAIAPKLVRKTVPEINKLLQKELRSALSELSEYDPAKFAEFEVADGDGTENNNTVQEDT
jgi:phage terminase Nu1 subunit (DNA packaging protein)